MILGFKTKINGNPTYFVEKIVKGLKETGIAKKDDKTINDAVCYNFLNAEIYSVVLPKFHTIREDKKGRWKPGTMIDFYINTRTKDMFGFAPRVPVLSIQKITMSYAWNDIINIWINGRELSPSERLELALNDGFDSWKDFFEFFYPVIKSTEDNFWKGKLIHWTDKKY